MCVCVCRGGVSRGVCVKGVSGVVYPPDQAPTSPDQAPTPLNCGQNDRQCENITFRMQSVTNDTTVRIDSVTHGVLLGDKVKS